MAESGGLLNRCTGLNLYQGFESPPHRQSSRAAGALAWRLGGDSLPVVPTLPAPTVTNPDPHPVIRSHRNFRYAQGSLESQLP